MYKTVIHKFLVKIRNSISPSVHYRAGLRRALYALNACILAIAFSIVNLVISSYYENWIGVFAYIDFIAICLIVLYLLHIQKVNAAKLLLISSSIVMYLLYASSMNYFGGAQYSWFTILLGMFALFSIKEHLYLGICFALLLTAILICEFTDYEMLSLNPDAMEGVKYQNRFSFFLNIIITSVSLYFLSINEYLTYKEKDKVNKNLKQITENLRQANQELDNFVYHASHDIRAPLTSMLGLIKIGKTEMDLENIKKLFSLQERTITRLDDYVKDILTISQVKRTELRLDKVQFDRIISSVLAHVQFMLKNKNIQIETFQDLPENFVSDEHRILSVFTNLLTNSIKFSDEKKKEKLIYIHLNTSELFKGGVEIKVKDNGIGIKKDNLDKVTSMFYFNNDKKMGTGYGLYIVKESVEKLEGKLTITSKLGSYTEVKIDLPNLGPYGSK